MELNYRPRGIGSNWIKCFVCGVARGLLCEDGVYYSGMCQPDMAAHVGSKENGERVVALFRAYGLHVALDYRESEPNWVQVKAGACDKHFRDLEHLFELTRPTGKISPNTLDMLVAVVESCGCVEGGACLVCAEGE